MYERIEGWLGGVTER